MLARFVRDSVVSERFGKLLRVKAAGTIVVDDLKRLSDSNNATGTTGSDLVSDPFYQLVVRGVFEVIRLLSLSTPLTHLTLNVDALISAPIQGFATTSRLAKGVVCTLLLSAAAVSLCAFVADNSSLAVSVEYLMVLVLPLLTRVLAICIHMLSSVLSRTYFLKIQVPNANDKIAEVLIALEILIQVVVVLHELLSANRLVACESLLGVVEGAEHFEESETGLFNTLKSSLHVWMARWIKVVFYFIKFENTGTKFFSCKYQSPLLPF